MAAGALILFPLILSLPVAASDDAAAEPFNLLDRQDAQLRRLEALIESLSETVASLQASLSSGSDHSVAASSSVVLPLDLETVSPVLTPHPGADAAGAGDRSPGVSVTKHKTSWSERFQFAAAARMEASPVVATVLPYEEADGHSKYFAVGDSYGRVYVFSSAGDVLIELPSLSESPVTSMLSYLSSRRNESLLFSGHEDGSVTAHRLYESSANSEDWLSLSVSSSKTFIRGSREVDSPPVSGLEVHQVGSVRYVIASDDGGRIRVFTENGTLYGTAIASSKPLAIMRQRLLFLTETGAASLDLRTMVVRETACEGLNGSVAKAYSFDSSERLKAYGFTASGDLIHVVLLGDLTNLKCWVRSVKKSEIDGPVAIQTIKGYLLVASYDKVFVYNISSQFYGRVGAPRLLFSAAIQDIKSLFLNSEALAGGTSNEKPLIAADREKLVVLGLGSGYIGIYNSNFPVFRVENNAVVWSGPALLFLLFLIAIWQFYVKKKDSLGWVPEDSFNSSAAASSSLLNSTATDRAYADGVRTDLRELRGGALRAPARRYTSPPRYTGGSGLPFRSGSADPGFRTPGELKFRGQNVEPAGFPKRREAMFPNSQVAEDHID
ncbi:uncharacterized membrane protein At1g75140-like [Zingiber officinale]|uniref:Uncharacterized protein n=1 Tax=Zingiber officinale TaxID=94328 RepID=A0A8J5LBE0_ZINOF|nr:uncharacterized membrane protein At1g75140-like [Zingiber officinale]KAG6512306.1 hypothetical protein ZIOFF_030406 [Zingiber officinale]